MAILHSLEKLWQRIKIPAPAPTPEAATALFLRHKSVERNRWNLLWRSPVPNIVSARSAPYGILVLYTKEFPPPRALQFGYALTERPTTGWVVMQASYGEVLQPGRLAFDCAPLWQGHENVVLVFGYTADPTVNTIEVTFEPDTTRHDNVTNGMFAIIGPAFDADAQFSFDTIREIRALDIHEQVVQRLDPTTALVRGKAYLQKSS